ncbi:hypothetical protein [Kribbella swartbergensis]
MADRFDLDAIDADDALLDLLAAGGESARSAGEHDPAVKLLAELRLAVEVEDELPVETIDDPESFLARCAALNPVTDPFARKVAARGLALGVAAVAALSVSGVAAAVTGDPLSPYEKVIEKMVDAVRPQTSFPTEQLDGMPVVDKTKIVKVAKDYQEKQEAKQVEQEQEAQADLFPPQSRVDGTPPLMRPPVDEKPIAVVKPIEPTVAEPTTAPEQTDGKTDEKPVDDQPAAEPTEQPTSEPTEQPAEEPTPVPEPTVPPTTTPPPAEPSDPVTTPPPNTGETGNNGETGEPGNKGETGDGETGSTPTTSPTTPPAQPGGDQGSNPGQAGDDSSGEQLPADDATPPAADTEPADSTTLPGGDTRPADDSAPAGDSKQPAGDAESADDSTPSAGDTEVSTPPAVQKPSDQAGNLVEEVEELVTPLLPTPTGAPVQPSAQRYFDSAAKHSSGKVTTGSVRATYAKGKHSSGKYAEGKHAAIARTHGSLEDKAVLRILGVVNPSKK